LDLESERFCSVASVTDRARLDRPSLWLRPSMPAHEDWVHVRAVREALLEAAAKEKTAPVSGTDAA
jgi:hypothetical protein